MPDVTGKTEQQAKSILGSAGFKSTTVTGTQPGANPGTVINQSPTAGTSAKIGSTVTITVTPTQLTVPAVVIGQTAPQPTAELSGARYNYSVTPSAGTGPAGYLPGTVYATSPPVGSPLAAGSSITIYVVAQQSPSPPPSTPPTSPSTSPSASTSPNANSGP